MNIIDISWPITPDITEYKDRTTVQLQQIKQYNTDGVRETMLCLHNHTGTHIDAPSHFTEHGGTSETISLSALVGPCRVLDLTDVTDCITKQDLQKHNIKTGERILLKTKNSNLASTAPFDYNFVYVGKEAAQYLADQKIVSVGIDYLGIERNQPGHETHKLLLQNNIPIIEGLRLADVQPGTYQLYCLPLNIPGIDGVPARAILTLLQ